MPTTFSTWNDLLFPTEQDIRIFLSQVDETRLLSTKTLSFHPPEFDPCKLPSDVHGVKDLPTKMYGHLRSILDTQCAHQAAQTGSPLTTNINQLVTPGMLFSHFHWFCGTFNFDISNKACGTDIAGNLSNMVRHIYGALTQTSNIPTSEREQPSDRRTVVTDRVYKLDNVIKILWEDNSSNVFDGFVGQLMQDLMTAEQSLEFPSSTTCHGYEAILAKISHHATEIQPRVRWAVIFSGLKYIIIYIPRSSERPTFYCSSIMDFCIGPGDPQQPAADAPPPIWSMLVYMLLTEYFDIDDDTLREKFGFPTPLGPSGPPGTSGDHSSSYCSAKVTRQSDGLKLKEPGPSYSGNLATAPLEMLVQCFDALPMALSLAGMPRSQACEKQRPFIHFDRYLGGGWSSVYASSRSHIIVKFAWLAKKDKAELQRQLRNEKAAYDRLTPLTRWVIPLCYGEYVWHGGRALIMSDEGPSLAALDTEFTSLGLIERLVLFAQLYLIHCQGICHRDFQPQNVLRKGWCRLKIVDFAFSDVNHSCPGWRECDELKVAWCKQLQLDRLALHREDGMLGKVKLVVGIVCGSFLFFLFVSIIALTVPRTGWLA